MSRLTATLAAFVSLGASVLAVSPNPPFPVGHLDVFPKLVETGSMPHLVWSVDLPPDTDADDFLIFIQQEQLPTGLVSQVPVDPTGEMLALFSILPNGSRFELWVVDAASNEALLVDEAFVAPYTPLVDVKIRSEDPYPVLPRTRADRPFDVDVTVNSLPVDPRLPPEVDECHSHASRSALWPGRNRQRLGSQPGRLAGHVFDCQQWHHHFSVRLALGPGRASREGTRRGTRHRFNPGDRIRSSDGDRFQIHSGLACGRRLDHRIVQWPGNQR